MRNTGTLVKVARIPGFVFSREGFKIVTVYFLEKDANCD
jgi:hypothetical protein